MTDVIDFLERMGQDAQLRHGSQREVELALTSAEIASELHGAILARDPSRLELVVGRRNVCCAQFPGKEDEDEDTEESPSREGEEIASLPMFMASTGLV